MKRIAIVGGGISGLSAAYYLAKAGHDCTLIEARSRLGGVIQTEQADGCVIEGGPDSFIAQKPWAMDLIRELGIEDQVIGSNDHLRKTFVLRGGRLIPLPDGVQFMAPTKVMPMITTPLLGLRSKAKMAMEWFRRPAEVSRDRSVAEFVKEHYGSEVNEYLAQPMLAGVYGGSPEKLSVNSVLPRFVELERRYGSVGRGLVRAMSRSQSGKAAGSPNSGPRSLFLSLRGGMQQLTDTLSGQLEGRVRVVTAAVGTIEGRSGAFQLKAGGDTISADEVVLATRAYQAAKLLQQMDSRLADLLAGIRYTSSVTVNLLYARPPFEHNLEGFGFLIPRAEQRLLTACTWVNTKFPHRATADRAVLRSFLSGREAEQASSSHDAEVADQAHQELSQLMHFRTEPATRRVYRWERAMAQYEVGHQKCIEEVESRLASLPGLHLSGNAFAGIGIPDCIRRSKMVAESIDP